jgi:hypothetical protein
MNEKNKKNQITPGPFSITCKICKKVLRPKEVNRCLYCDNVICNECMKYGLCTDHYHILNDHDKQIFKRNYRSRRNYIIPAIIFMGLLVVSYIFLEFNLDFGLGIWFTISLAAIEVLGAIIFMIFSLIQRRYQKKKIPYLKDIVKKYESKDI